MKLIRLMEITKKKGGGTQTLPMLLNPEIIATVTTGKLEKDEVPIIGQPTGESMTFIQFRNNSGTFVQETLDQVADLVSDPIGAILGKN